MIFRILCLMWVALLPVFAQAQAPGTLDSTFSDDGIIELKFAGARTGFFRVLVQPDQKVVVIGEYWPSAGSSHPLVLRYLPDGTLDPAFGDNGTVSLPTLLLSAREGVILPDGKIMVVGYVGNGSISSIRLLENGDLDTSYGSQGIQSFWPGFYLSRIEEIALSPDGRLLLVGISKMLSPPGPDHSFVMKLAENGRPDSTFANNGVVDFAPIGTDQTPVVLYGGEMQTDGRMIVVGKIGAAGTNEKWYVARLAGSELDSTFGTNGVVIIDHGTSGEVAQDAVVQPDGKIIVGGTATLGSGFQFTIRRFGPDGAEDLSFGLGGVGQAGMECCYSVIFDLQLQDDGKIIAAGYAAAVQGQRRFAVGRFKTNGLLDQTFANAGKFLPDLTVAPEVATALAVSTQADGKILVAGTTATNLGVENGVLVRLNAAGSVATSEAFMPPATIALAPNPVAGDNPRLSYRLEKPTDVTVTLHDISGRQLATLLDDGPRAAGDVEEDLSLPVDLAPAVYVLRLQTPGQQHFVRFVKSN